MYAIIENGGHQLRVEEGQELDIDFRDLSSGDAVTFDRVLAVRDDSGLTVGQPLVASATVTAEVLAASAGPKLVVQKFTRRKNARRRTGHRQIYTLIKITKISVG